MDQTTLELAEVYETLSLDGEVGETTRSESVTGRLDLAEL